jgi:sugar phosphate isomerase/epimerase
MNITRRTFVKNSALTVAGTALFSRQILSSRKDKHLLGIQLYSVRDDMKKDPAGTLKQLSAMGYKNVEHANYVDRKFYGYNAADFKKLLQDSGLEMHSGHTVMGPKHWDESKNDFTDLWKFTVEDAATVGQNYVISPWLDESYRKDYDGLIKFLNVFNKSGELCKKSGMRFGYHNHDFEFSQKLNGEILYDIILKNTDPNLVIQQLDTGNLYNGGAKAIDIAQQYPNRFLSVHVKDEIPASTGKEKYESTILGAGIVNTRDVIALVGKHNKGVHYIIEQESYQGKTPLDCAKEDLGVMKSWGY